MHFKARSAFATAAAAALVLSSAAPASADDVNVTSSDPVFVTADDGVPTMTLGVGEKASLLLTYGESNPEKLSQGGGPPIYGPGIEGCELKGAKDVNPRDTQLVLGVDDETDGVITLGAEMVVFEHCTDEVDGVEVPATRTLTLTAGSEAGETMVAFYQHEGTFAVAGAHFEIPESFRVVVEAEGRTATEIANEFLNHLASPEMLLACQAAVGTNGNEQNWHGVLISEVSHQFGDRLFSESEESIVISYLVERCSS